MSTLAPPALSPSFPEITGRLRCLLDNLAPCLSSTGARAVTPEEMTELLSWLMRAGQRLRNLPDKKDAALEQELAEYRTQVERLHTLLPSLHAVLLAERARLERERERVSRAGEWMRMSRQTL